jgi:hypothetical protein
MKNQRIMPEDIATFKHKGNTITRTIIGIFNSCDGVLFSYYFKNELHWDSANSIDTLISKTKYKPKTVIL